MAPAPADADDAELAATLVALTLAYVTGRGLITQPALQPDGARLDGRVVRSPARQALVPSLVPREDLANALSLNTAMMQAASIAGPALGGILIATGADVGYLLNAISLGS